MKLGYRDRIVDLAVGVFALAIYLLTLAPTVTWRNNGADSGDLVSAAFTLGIPHPTGYPLYTIVAALYSHLPFGEPAQNVNLLSALSATAAMVLACIAGRRLIPNSALLSRWIPPTLALVFAFAPAVWSQATIAEVNASANLLAAALFTVLFSDSPRRLYLAAAIFGIGLAHHLTILLLLPTVIVLLVSTRWTWSQFKWGILVLIAPLALYAYLPLRASSHPPINWGDPETLDGFLWVISGASYRSYLFAVSPDEIFSRVALTARFLFEQFTVIGVALGVWGASQMGMRTDSATRQRFLALMLAFVLPVAFAVVYASRDSFVYLLPAFLVFLFWMMYGANSLAESWLRLSARLLGERTGRSNTTKSTLLFGVSALLLVLYPLYNLVANFNAMDVSYDYAAFDYAKKIFDEIPNQAIIIADGDDHLFALEYYRYVIARQSEVSVVSAELLQYSWYFDQVRRTAPSVNASAVSQPNRLGAVIDAGLAQGRRVYATVQNEWFLRYAMEQREGYFRVIGRLP